jgi:DNA-binding NtrC family response regulator
VFEVYLPAAGKTAPGDDVVQRPASAADGGVGSGRAVFVIEDEESLRDAVCKMLRKKNFSVLEARDGTVGVELFRARHADIGVVLLDLTMPGTPGREVLSELKRIRPDVKIIVTTAYSQDAAAASLDNERGWAFIRKPYQIADLIQLVHKGLCS